MAVGEAAGQVDADLGDIAVAIESLAHNLPETAQDGYGLQAFYEWAAPKGVLAITVVSADGQVLDIGEHLLEPLEGDFRILEAEHMVHVLNAPSPAATASLSIGETISDMARRNFSLD